MKYLKVCLLICLSLFCIGGFYYTLSHFEKEDPPKAPIQKIAQTGPLKGGLKTAYLSEVLGLSKDQPKYLSPDEAEAILKKNPLIKNVYVSYLDSDTLYIDYTLHNPTFALIDLEDAALDLEGHLFPLSPYFTPKKLPELYLGLSEVSSWDTPLPEEALAMAYHLFSLLKEKVKRIDLSHIDAKSLGQREVVVILEYPGGVLHTLRLSPKRYEQELQNYRKLHSKIIDRSLVIDLRIPQIGYVHAL